MNHSCGQTHRHVSQGFRAHADKYDSIADSTSGGHDFKLAPAKEQLYSAYVGNVEVALSKPDDTGRTCYLEADYTDEKTGKSILVKVVDAKQYGLSAQSMYRVDELRKLDSMKLSLDDNKYFYYVTLLASRMMAVLANHTESVSQIDVKLGQFDADTKTKARLQQDYKPDLLQGKPVRTLMAYKKIYRTAVVKNSCVDVLFNIQNYVNFLSDKVGLWGIENKPYFVAVANIDNLDNAFWTGEYMVFGNGQSDFYPLTCLDVCGHEIGHGVVQQLAGLEYSKHSGALNESFADVIGTMFEFWMYDKYNGANSDPRDDLLGKADYLIGEDLSVSEVPLRNMEDPSKGLSPQPAVYKGVNYFNPNNSADNGGVHVNSGITNHCFYLMATKTSRDKAFTQFMDCLKGLSTRATFIEFRDVLKRVTNNDPVVVECLAKVGLTDQALSDVGGYTPRPVPAPPKPTPKPPPTPRPTPTPTPAPTPPTNTPTICPPWYPPHQHIHNELTCPPLPRYNARLGARHPQCEHCNQTYPLGFNIETSHTTGSK